uniref:Uncharacterized protein n=1 Tax=Anguilla anguilla TaxID=7936 RepID=A0A0E9UDE5_ANGAN
MKAEPLWRPELTSATFQANLIHG